MLKINEIYIKNRRTRNRDIIYRELKHVKKQSKYLQ